MIMKNLLLFMLFEVFVFSFLFHPILLPLSLYSNLSLYRCRLSTISPRRRNDLCYYSFNILKAREQLSVEMSKLRMSGEARLNEESGTIFTHFHSKIISISFSFSHLINSILIFLNKRKQ